MQRSSRYSLWSSLMALSLLSSGGTGCIDEVDQDAGYDSDRADSREIRLRAGGTSVFLQSDWTRQERELGGQLQEVFVFQGSASRDIVSGQSFGVNGPQGHFVARGPRSFDVLWPVSEIEPLISGTQPFVVLNFEAGGEHAEKLSVRYAPRVRVADMGGTGFLFTNQLMPVVVAGQTVYRLAGTSTSRVSSPRVRIGDAHWLENSEAGNTIEQVSKVDDFHLNIDFLPSDVAELSEEGVTLNVQRTRDARFVLVSEKARLLVGRIGPQPTPSCGFFTKKCIEGTAPGTLDLAHCGEATEVHLCASEGVVATNTAVSQARSSAAGHINNELSDAADALVGADRSDELVAAAKLYVDERLAEQSERWYLDPEAWATSLHHVVDKAIVDVYANPFLMMPHRDSTDPSLSDRAVDSLFEHLAVRDTFEDFANRSMRQLLRDLRAEHVQTLRVLRETVVFAGNVDFAEGDWVGLPVFFIRDLAENSFRADVEID